MLKCKLKIVTWDIVLESCQSSQIEVDWRVSSNMVWEEKVLIYLYNMLSESRIGLKLICQIFRCTVQYAVGPRQEKERTLNMEDR